MATKQTTAVDYFFDKIKSNFEHDGDKLESVAFLYAICKDKEREQHISAYEAGQDDGYQYHVNGLPRYDSETWYDNNYGIHSNHSEQALEMGREQVRLPRWVQFSERKPMENKPYYIKGKGGYGGYEFYDSEDEKFYFRSNIPVNKFADEYLQWLEE